MRDFKAAPKIIGIDSTLSLAKRDKISMFVIRRLPRYYRFLSELKDNGVTGSLPKSFLTRWVYRLSNSSGS